VSLRINQIVNCKDSSGRTAVMLAAMQGSADNVDLCLKVGLSCDVSGST
jgi:ankyrin repeat protein